MWWSSTRTPTRMRWWCLWTTWGTPAATATSRVTPPSGGLTMPRSRAGRQEQGPLRRPFSVQLHFRGAPYRGVPRPVPSFDPPEVRAGHIPGRPQDPLVSRLLPVPHVPCPASLARARDAWSPASLPWSHSKGHQGLRPPELSSLPLHLFICYALRKVAQSPAPNWSLTGAPGPGPRCRAGCTGHPGLKCGGSDEGPGPGWVWDCRCSINVH